MQIRNKPHDKISSNIHLCIQLTLIKFLALFQALKVIEDYDNARKQDQEVTQTLTSENQKLNNQCESLTSLLEEERQAHSNTASISWRN